MQLHHSGHHATYVKNLNATLASLSALSSSSAPDSLPGTLALQQALRFNAGGHVNHSLFWEGMAPANSPAARTEAAPRLSAAIAARWGSVEGFRAALAKALLGIQGSGWAWLVGEGGVSLRIVTTKDQEAVVEEGSVPILGVDMWEHAYYL